MDRDIAIPHDRYSKVRPTGPAARLVVAEPNRQIADVLRLALQWHGLGEPRMTEEAEETLDLLGAVAQDVDLVLMAFGGPDESIDLRLLEVLRAIRSPVRLACYGSLSPEDYALRTRELVGAAAYIDLAGTWGVARWVHDLITEPVTVREILSTARVPQTLSRRWAKAIYDAAPGETFALPPASALN